MPTRREAAWELGGRDESSNRPLVISTYRTCFRREPGAGSGRSSRKGEGEEVRQERGTGARKDTGGTEGEEGEGIKGGELRIQHMSTCGSGREEDARTGAR